MNIKNLFLSALAVASLGVAACDNIGNAPSGKSADEMKDYVNKQSPEEQIKMWQASPAPPAEKAKKIAEIRQKYNLKDDGQGAGANFPGDPRAGG